MSIHTTLRHVFLDASALASYLLFPMLPEPGGQRIRNFLTLNRRANRCYSNEPCLTETLTVLKKKRRDKKIDTLEYQRRIFMLQSMVKSGQISISSFDYWNNDYSMQALKLISKYDIDYLDAIQIVDLRMGPFKSWIGESASILVTNDKGLRDAARGENLRVWYPNDEEFDQTADNNSYNRTR